VQLSLEAGFSAHLVKPVDPESLNRAIAVVLGETIGS
jgi:CheY-like chemotaxis protein